MRTARIAWLLATALLAALSAASLQPSPLGTDPGFTALTASPGDFSRMTVRSQIRISFAGDVMMHDTQILGGRTTDESYDFRESFAYVRPYLMQSDYVIANLETTLGGPDRAYRGYPRFSAPDALVDALSWAGVDMLVHCNNHVLDTGVEGLLRSRRFLLERGLDFAGTRSDPSQDRNSYFMLSGKRFALVSGTYGTNGLVLPQGSEYMVNGLDPERLTQDVQRAVAQADYVICFLHVGTEYAEEPNSFQTQLANDLVAAGADAVIASHPHVVQTDGFIEESIVVYSLGNFISAQRGAKRRTGMIYTITLEQDHLSDTLRFERCEYLPVFTYRAADGNRPYYLGPASGDTEGNGGWRTERQDEPMARTGLAYLARTVRFAERITAPSMDGTVEYK